MGRKAIIGFVIVFMISGILHQFIFQDSQVAGLERRGEELIRFHVLANSDSPGDQRLKLKVRDRVIEEMALDLGKSQSIEETREIIGKSLERIESVAQDEIRQNGSTYGAVAYLEEHTFPTKRYGDVVFPAGEYEALRIVIGEGIGQNWWCVMFPPLCFVDVKNGLADEKTQRQLKEVLSEEEYQLVRMAAEEGQVTLELRSKIVDLYKNSKEQVNRFASLF
ncbi:stage II sporulation protein R [Alkaliphilus metalliredigens]|nr:stage II sporulation protein R [Alkaliphilus metalliredigens]